MQECNINVVGCRLLQSWKHCQHSKLLYDFVVVVVIAVSDVVTKFDVDGVVGIVVVAVVVVVVVVVVVDVVESMLLQWSDVQQHLALLPAHSFEHFLCSIQPRSDANPFVNCCNRYT